MPGIKHSVEAGNGKQNQHLLTVSDEQINKINY
jgi:hypothetical protein